MISSKNLFYSIIELQIIMKDNYTYSQVIGYYFKFVSALFPISIFLLLEFEQNDSTLLFISLLIIRPDILFLKALGFWEFYGYIIVGCVYISHKVCLIALLYTYQNMSELSISKFNRGILKILSFHQTFYYPLIHLLQSMVCMQSFNASLQNENIYSSAISFIVFILIQIDALISYYCIEPLLTYNLRLLDRMDTTIFDLLLHFLKALQLVLFGLFKLQLGHKLVQIILTLIISIIENFQEYINQQYIFDSIRYLHYYLNVFQFLYCFCFIIEKQTKSTDIRFTFTLLFCPILVQLILQFDQRIKNKQFVGQFKNQSQLYFNSVLYSLVRSLNNCDCNNQINYIRSSLILFKHRKECKSINCICQLDLLEISLDNGSAETIENQYFQNHFSQISKQIFNKNTKSCMKYKFSALLYSFNQFILAVKYFYVVLGNQETIKKSKYKINMPVNAFLQIDKSENIPFMMQLRILYLVNEAKKKINLELTDTKHKQFEISNQIQKFFQHEQELSEIITQIRTTAIEKIKFYSFLKNSKDLKLDYLSDRVVQITSLLDRLTINMKNKYNIFPSKKLQTIVCFIESNINNNFAEANKILNLNAISEETLLKFNSSSSFNLYSDEISYIICSVEEDYQNLKIERASQTFQKTYETLDFKQVLPLFVVQTHPLVVSRFLKSGQSKFYRQFKQNYIKGNDGFTKVMKLCFDNMQTIFNNQMTLLAFIQQTEEYSSYLMIDTNKQVRSMTKMLLNQFGYDDEFIVNNKITENWFEFVNITKLIPSFEQLSDSPVAKVNNVQFQFYNLNQLVNNQNRIQNIEINSIREHTQLQMIEYSVDIVIVRQDIYGLTYYIIEFIKVIEIESEQNSKVSSAGFNISELQISIEELEANKVNSKVKDKESVKIAKHNENDKNSTKKQQYLEMHFQKEVHILSPNQSNMETSKQCLQPYFERVASFQQQQYYTIPNQPKIADKNIFEEIESNEKHISESGSQVQNHLGSKASSIFEVKTYKYAKQYDFYEKITQKMVSKPIQICMFIIFLQLSLNIIYSSMIITLQHSDIQRFIKEIDMISLHSSVMAPHDLFYAEKSTITAYQKLYRTKKITADELSALVDPLFDNIDLGYEEMRDNFYALLLNQYLQDFLSDIQTDVYFMKENDTQIYSTTLYFKELILVELQYQYASKVTFDRRESPAGQPYQVFQISNYFKIHDTLKILTHEIKLYSQHRASVTQDKWVIIWILFLVINFLLACAALVYLHKNLVVYEKFLKILFYVDITLFNLEIEKLKKISDSLESNPDGLYQFQFNDSNKSIKSSTATQVTNKAFKIQEHMDQKQLKRVSIIVQIFLLFCYFCLVSTLVNQKNTRYLDRYIETTDLYKLIQDLRFRSNVFLYRDLKLKWANFTYATDEDLRLLYELIYDSKNVMRSYLSDYLNPNFDKYLCSDNFVQLYYDVQHNNLCNYLTDQYNKFMGRYCYVALDGTIVQGMVPCLTFILNSIETEQAVNNFTSQLELKYYETEGGLLVTRVFGNISSSLKAGIIQITEEKNQFDYIFSGINLTFCIVVGFILIVILKEYYINQFYHIRKILNLMPIYILIHDNSLERLLRQYYVTQQF